MINSFTKQLFVVSLIIATSQFLFSQPPSADIRLNQIGFYPAMPKIAVVKGANALPFYVLKTLTDTIYKGTLTSAQTWSYSQESVSIADFSSVQTTGSFRISVPGIGSSYQSNIKSRAHENVAKGVLKGYYYQRVSTPLPAAHAGTWARAEGHPDNNVLIHPSAATSQRPANSSISSPRGWYDAGDYNKYIVNSGISTYTILATYEYFPEFCAALNTNIPESGNGIPDILDEALWNIRWMLTMQDPNDGGVYAKLTNANFDGFVMPAAATTTRYVVMKSTAATLDFAAVMAQSARIFSKFNDALPGFSDSCLQASLQAWTWAKNNPAIYYNQSQMNSLYNPDIVTGEYGDGNVSDEFAWAAAELFTTTLRDSFATTANQVTTSAASVPSWPGVRTLGLYTFASNLKNIAAKIDTNTVRSRLITLANSLRNTMNTSAYKVVMGNQNGNFSWGSNAVAANQGMELLVAFRLTHDSTYLNAALSNLDYLLGRNATTYSFVTGFGSKTPQNIHHRPSAADGIAAPVPGLLAGGPNPGREDGVPYPSTLPALAYTDNVDSYASNEICINWNAPIVFLAIGIESILSPDGLPTSVNKNTSPLPEGFRLDQNYPNPFNPATTINYRINQPGFASIKIFDTLGREIKTLLSDNVSEGDYSVPFYADNMPSGVYFYKLAAGSFSETKKMILLK